MKPAAASDSTATGLDQGYARARKLGVGIEPGAHPERGVETQIGNPITQIGSALTALSQWNPWKQKNTTGNYKSPSTVHDK